MPYSALLSLTIAVLPHFRYHWRTLFWKAGVLLRAKNASLLYHHSNLTVEVPSMSNRGV
jgi:hypothetical protein